MSDLNRIYLAPSPMNSWYNGSEAVSPVNAGTFDEQKPDVLWPYSAD